MLAGANERLAPRRGPRFRPFPGARAADHIPSTAGPK